MNRIKPGWAQDAPARVVLFHAQNPSGAAFTRGCVCTFCRPCACSFGKNALCAARVEGFSRAVGLGMRCRLQSRIVRIRVPFRRLCALAPVRLGKHAFCRACGRYARAPFAPLAALAPVCLGKTRFAPRMRKDFPAPPSGGYARVPLPHPAYPPHNFSQEGGFFT